jgi:hypothetical protein
MADTIARTSGVVHWILVADLLNCVSEGAHGP